MTLKDWIDLKGLSQRQAAEILDLPESVISRIVTKINKPSLDNALQIQRLTGGAVRPEDLA